MKDLRTEKRNVERFEKRLNKGLDALDRLVSKPSLFVSDHFYSIRNEIDLTTEIMLISLDEMNGVDRSLSESNHNSNNSDNIDSNGMADTDDLSPKMVNEIREIMMDEIKKHETECLETLKKSSRIAVPGVVSTEQAEDAETLRARERVKAYRDEMQSLFDKTTSPAEMSKDELSRFQAAYEALFNKIDKDSTDLKRKLLLGKTVFFKKAYLNKLGILVVFEDDFLTDNEVSLIKEITFTTKPRRSLTKNSFILLRIQNYLYRVRENNYSRKKKHHLSKDKSSKEAITARVVFKIDSNILRQKWNESLTLFEQSSKPSDDDAIIGLFDFFFHVDLYELALESFEPDAFYYLPGLEGLTIGYNRIARVESNMFNGLLNLKYLDMSSNSIHLIDETAFDRLTHLQRLTLNHSKIKSLTRAHFEKLSKLKNLSMTNSLLDLSPPFFDPLTFSKLSNLTELNLSNNQIREIGPGIFDRLQKLKTLLLQSNMIERLETSFFETPAPNDLEVLNLSQNQIRSIKPIAFKHLSNLKTLNLSDNVIEAIEPDTFQHMKSLKTLNLRKNNISVLPSGVFRELVELQNLVLQSNFIEALHSATFQDLKRLQTLDLSENKIKTVKGVSFSMMKNLRTLLFYDNLIESLDDGQLFEDLPALEVVNFRNNRIQKIDSSILSKISAISHFDISKNPIVDVQELAFQFMQELETLRLEHTRISSINHKVFQGLGNLLTLYISECRFESIEEMSFINLLNLEFLFLNSSYIRSLNSSAFNCLFNLQQLNISRNMIEHLEENTFECLNKLEYLYLNNNSLTKIEPNTFNGLENLVYLFLDSNKIEDIKDGAFKHLKSLGQLYLSSNCIKHLKSAIFEGLVSLSQLRLSNNEIEELNEANLFQPLLGLKSLYLNNNKIRSIRPDALFSLSLLTNLDLSFNLLDDDSFDAHLLESLHSLEDLNLTYNLLSRFDPELMRSPVMYLSLWKNKLKQLEDGMFESVPTLINLNVGSNRLTHMSKNAFRGLEQLTSLNVFSNKITSIDQGTFQILKNLTNLSVNSNFLQKLPKNVFAGMKELAGFMASNNMIRRLSDFIQIDEEEERIPNSSVSISVSDQLNGQDSKKVGLFAVLTNLDVSSNLIETLDDFNFEQICPNLTYLIANSNSLTQLGEATLRGLSNLSYLQVSSNKIDEIHEDAFTHCNRIEYVFLTKNKIERLPENLFNRTVSIRTINFGHNKISSIPAQFFKNLTKLNEVDFQANQLTNENDWSSLLADADQLTQINLSENLIDRLNEDVFRGMVKLQGLYLSKNKIKRLERGVLAGLQSLRIVELNSNEIEFVDDDAFQGLNISHLNFSENKIKGIEFLKHLKTASQISLSKNMVEEISSTSFNELRSVNDLDLCQNKLTKLSKDLFKANRVKTLFTLRLDENQITEIESEAFESIFEIQNLYLANNKIIHLNWDSLKRLDKLRVLNLSSNPLETLVDPKSGENVLTYLESCNDLDLSKTKLKRLSVDSFSKMHSLTNLNLSQCELDDLGGAFKARIPIDKLNLSKNQLTKISADFFEGLFKLRELNLDGNLLTQIDHALFAKLPALKSLSLNKNPELGNDILIRDLFSHESQIFKLQTLSICEVGLETLKEESFVSLPFLESLNLSKNKLIKFESSFLKGLTRLSKLTLSGNQLDHLSTDAFEHIPSIQEIYLSSNNIKHISRETFVGLKKLSTLDLSENEILSIEGVDIPTDPEKLNLFALTNRESMLRILDLSKNKLKSTTHVKKLIYGVKKLEYLNLSDNDLESIDDEYFFSSDYFSNLVQIRLDNNKLKHFNEKAFKSDSLSSLTELSLCGNDLNHAKVDFGSLISLEYLDIRRNSIESLAMTDLTGLISIKRLFFDGILENNHANGNADVLQDFHRLSELKRNAKIEEIFESARNLGIEPSHVYLSEKFVRDFESL